MNARAETLLFNAARAQIVTEVIRPALAAGNIVLCDRFADSTLAYQGYGHQQDIAELARLIEYATGGLRPDLTVYLDLPPSEGIRRNRGQADGEWNRLDAQELSFYQRVEAGYRQLIEQEPARWIVIDAGRSREEVHHDIVRAVQERLSAFVPSG
jgi:dTMP kinase